MLKQLRLKIIKTLMLSLSCLIATQAFANPQTEEHWYIVLLEGQRAGYSHHQTVINKKDITTQQTMKLTIKRGTMAIEIEQSSSFKETPSGEPLESSSKLLASMMAMETQIKFNGNTANVTSSQMGRQTSNTIQLPDGDWLTPHQERKELAKRLAAGDQNITLNSLQTTDGLQVVKINMTIGEQETIDVFGKAIPARPAQATMSNMPNIPVSSFINNEGLPLRTVMNMAGMKIELVLADQQLALSPLDPPELMAQTFIKPSRTIQNPRQTRQAVYDLSLKKQQGGLTLDVPKAAAQHAIFNGDTVRVVIDLDRPVAPGRDTPKPVHLEASAFVDYNDPAIQQLTAQALRGQAKSDDAAKASAIRQFVRDYIGLKDLSVGFATAGETARTRQGDCTEHAVLLVAMLRGAGIPSRTVSGLVYADQFAGSRGIFGYHMWAQAWIEDSETKQGRWVDLDAALPGAEQGFDATHIGLLYADLGAEGGFTNDMVQLVPLLGNLDIKVVSAE